MAECERLAWEGFDIVTPERWKALVRHVKEKVEDHYWKGDRLTNHNVIGDFTIRIGSRPNDPDASDTSNNSFSSDSDNPMADED